MADWNEEHFELSKIGSVEVPVTSKTIRGGRRVARHEFPLRNGQAIENMGRDPRIITLTIPFFRGIGENFYPDRKRDLLDIIENDVDRGTVEYVDQEIGPIPVTVTDYTWNFEGERRGGGVMNVTLEEDNLVAGIDGISDIDARSFSFELAAVFDFAIDALPPLTLQDFQAKTGFIQRMTDFVNDFYDSVDDVAVAVDDYAAYLDAAANTLNRLVNYPPFSNLENWSIVNSVIDLLGALTEAVEREQAAGPSFSTYTVPSDASVYAIAQDFYGDSVYGDEITFNNDIVNPMSVPTGTQLRMVER